MPSITCWGSSPVTSRAPRSTSGEITRCMNDDSYGSTGASSCSCSSRRSTLGGRFGNAIASTSSVTVAAARNAITISIARSPASAHA